MIDLIHRLLGAGRISALVEDSKRRSRCQPASPSAKLPTSQNQIFFLVKFHRLIPPHLDQFCFK